MLQQFTLILLALSFVSTTPINSNEIPNPFEGLLPNLLTPTNSSTTTNHPNCPIHTSTHLNGSNIDVFKGYNISSPDGSIHATFIGLGATITNLYVKDRNNHFRDIILGYDNHTEYLTDTPVNYFGPVVGRYANRIRNSSFSIPPEQNLENVDPKNIYHVTPNEFNNNDTLHGGLIGTSRSGFNLLSHKKDQIVFGLLDKDGVEGFPGNLFAKITYTLKNNSKWIIDFDVHAFELTPILLSSHVYWNLDAYQGDIYSNSSFGSILEHELYIKSKQFIEIDSILVPTGVLGDIKPNSALDFNKPKLIGAQFNETLGLCGTGCTGYDNAWIYDNHTIDDVVMTLSSPNSGIKLSVTTDQPALQVYSCNGQKGLIKRKGTQTSSGTTTSSYDQFSCLVLEQQGYIGGINQPQWGQNQIYGPDREYKWHSEYSFSTFD